MEVQIVSILKKEYNKKTGLWEILEQRVNNVQKLTIDLLNDDFAISSMKELRYLFLNKEWYKLSLNSYKQCRKKKLISI